MVATRDASKSLTQGHVAVYARDTRWRRAMAKRLSQAGHSHGEAANLEEIQQLLRRQRFDVLALKVRDEDDARGVAQALEGVALPPHGILVGSGSALPLILQGRRRATFRYVPGTASADELIRLVDASISAGTWEETRTENGKSTHIEEVDLEEAIESAASAVYTQAKRKGQRLHTLVEGPGASALADPTKLRRAFVVLLRMVVNLAPRGALISIEARAGRDEWAIRLHASANRRPAVDPAQLAEALREQTQALTAASGDIRQQGGLLWVELQGPGGLGLCLTLPLPPGAEQSSA